jgi:hypothetical protein
MLLERRRYRAHRASHDMGHRSACAGSTRCLVARSAARRQRTAAHARRRACGCAPPATECRVVGAPGVCLPLRRQRVAILSAQQRTHAQHDAHFCQIPCKEGPRR